MPHDLKSRRILVWHVHGSWSAALVAGRHHYLLPLTESSDPLGRGLCGRQWSRAVEVPAGSLQDEDIDMVILQRPEELDLVQRWTGRAPGRDIPAVYVEHNAPRPHPVDSVHPVAGRDDIPLVHVTAFNALMWDNGIAPTTVIDHGVADPGSLYTGEVLGAATMINEPVRRGRTVGTDLLAQLAAYAPISVWGMGTEQLNGSQFGGRVTGRGDLDAVTVKAEIARHRVYLHTARWTSLGLSLLEAMYVGMPVVAVGSTMAPLVIPPEAGVVSADPEVLGIALRSYLHDHGAAQAAGKAAREFAAAHFGLDRFLADWDALIGQCCP